MQHGRTFKFPRASVMFRSIHFPSCMLLSHLILLLSHPWNSQANDALLVRHERRSISSEKAVICDVLERLENSYDVPPDAYDEPRPHYQSAPEPSPPSSGNSYRHPLPSEPKSLDELLADCEVDCSSSDHPSISLCQSEIFWDSLVQRLTNDPYKTQKMTLHTGDQNVAEESQYPKPFTFLDASSFSTSHSNELPSITGFVSTSQVQNMYQSHCDQNQDVLLSQKHFRTLKSSKPVQRRLKRKHSAPLMNGDFFPEEDSALPITQHMPLIHQHCSGSGPDTSPQFDKSDDIQASRDGNASTDLMAFTKETASRKCKVTRKQKDFKKSVAPAQDKTKSKKKLKTREAFYKIHLFNEQDEEFLEGLLHSDTKMRLSALKKYIEKVRPQAKFTGTESFEELKQSIEKEFHVAEGHPSPFQWSLDKKEGNILDQSTHPIWLEFLEFYRQNRLKQVQKADCNTNYHDRNEKIHLLFARAGAQRLNSLGIYTRIDNYFNNMENSLHDQARQCGRPCHLNGRVRHILIPAREATISILYQLELLLRLSTPSLQDYEHIHKDYLLEVMNHTEAFWQEFKPFHKEYNKQVQYAVSEEDAAGPLTLTEKMYKLFEKSSGNVPRVLRITRTLLSQWCLNKNALFFAFLHPDDRSKTSCEFNSFLTDCAIHDLVHMIA